MVDRSIEEGAKALYQTLICQKPCSVRQLASQMSMSRNTVYRLLKILEQKDWVIIYKNGRRNTPIPTQPAKHQKTQLDRAIERDKMAMRSGENKMHLLLELLLDVDETAKSARPWFIQNPQSKEFLEYDRFAPEIRVAWEFDGQQHYESTPQFPGQAELKKRQHRDMIKRELSVKAKVDLVTVTVKDLSIKTMLDKMPEHVPIRLFDVNGLYAQGIEQLCSEYMAFVTRAIARDVRREDQMQKR